MNRKKFFAAIFGFGAMRLSAQSTTTGQAPSVTRIQPSQIVIPQSATGWALIGVGPGTSLSAGQVLALGSNLSVSNNVLNVTAPNATLPTFVTGEVHQVTAAQPTFTLAKSTANASTVAVFRNGLRQALTVDYTVAGNVVTFTSASTPGADEIVSFDYQA